jgi:hypothetical protein
VHLIKQVNLTPTKHAQIGLTTDGVLIKTGILPTFIIREEDGQAAAVDGGSTRTARHVIQVLAGVDRALQSIYKIMTGKHQADINNHLHQHPQLTDHRLHPLQYQPLFQHLRLKQIHQRLTLPIQ